MKKNLDFGGIVENQDTLRQRLEKLIKKNPRSIDYLAKQMKIHRVTLMKFLKKERVAMTPALKIQNFIESEEFKEKNPDLKKQSSIK